MHTSALTQDIIALLDPLSQLVSVIIIPRFGRRTLILLSALIVGIINIMIGVFEVADINVGAFIMFLALVFFTSIAQEPCGFLYILETSPNSIFGVVYFLGNAITIILGYIQPPIVDSLGPAYIFFFFGASKLTIMAVQYFYLRETISLTDREKKTVYLPRKYKAIIPE